MKILLITLMTKEGETHHSLRVIEEPTTEELERIVAINGVFSDESRLEEFHKWLRTEQVKRPNWGYALGDAGILYGPFDKVVICGGTQ